MARTESININGESQLCVNITKIVGHAGANLKEDVMLIQALFNYIAKGLSADPSAWAASIKFLKYRVTWMAKLNRQSVRFRYGMPLSYRCVGSTGASIQQLTKIASSRISGSQLWL